MTAAELAVVFNKLSASGYFDFREVFGGLICLLASDGSDIMNSPNENLSLVERRLRRLLSELGVTAKIQEGLIVVVIGAMREYRKAESTSKTLKKAAPRQRRRAAASPPPAMTCGELASEVIHLTLSEYFEFLRVVGRSAVYPNDIFNSRNGCLGLIRNRLRCLLAKQGVPKKTLDLLMAAVRGEMREYGEAKATIRSVTSGGQPHFRLEMRKTRRKRP